ncbi:hypothetical protein DOTSEDRAFT_132524 [Dothistroma septosporum NZE10]|uniref:Uncharacterized protein n=1 Tax=Dothistroma septosporum (strain NZE10 / CBS 128990) TaxID=675120 RepID=M2YMP8_DOTSN|nr:hypothetical protein DOTSEDRAFT_132524 [Dothistroma septosporum NZE10]
MPMVWDPSAEAKLLSEIFKICDVKVTEAQRQQLAAIMGTSSLPEVLSIPSHADFNNTGCTPKAIIHRLAKFKSGNGGSAGGEAKKMIPVKRGASGAAKKSGAGRKNAMTPEEDNEEVGKIATPPPSERGKKMKIKEEPESDGIETGEDVGEGLRRGGEESESEI